jgi:hypothetical protein
MMSPPLYVCQTETYNTINEIKDNPKSKLRKKLEAEQKLNSMQPQSTHRCYVFIIKDWEF